MLMFAFSDLYKCVHIAMKSTTLWPSFSNEGDCNKNLSSGADFVP